MPSRVLYLGFQPEDADDLGIDAELDAIQSRLAHASGSNDLELIQRQDVDVEDLPTLLAQIQPEVLHIASHGQDGGRLFLRSRGRYRAIDPVDVQTILAGASPQLRLVVLNACYSEPLATALSAQGRFAIGSTRRVPSENASSFAGVLYGLIAEGKDLKMAHSEAMAAAMADDRALRGVFKIREPEGARAEELVLAPRLAVATALEAAPPPQRVKPNQLLLLLDVYAGAVSLDELESWMDDHRELRVKLRLSEFMARLGVEPLSALTTEVDWAGLSEATQALLDAAAAALPDDGRPVDYTIGGNAPHPVFAHVGYALSAWAGRRQTLLHRNKEDGTWVRIDLGEGQPVSGPRYFQRRPGLERGRGSPSNGQLGLYLSAFGGEVPTSVAEFFNRNQRNLGEVLGLLHTTQDPNRGDRVTPLTRETGASAAAELQRASTEIALAWPKHSGLVLFVNGPDILAFLAARALNPNQAGGRLGLAWYNRPQGAYQLAYELPLDVRRPPYVPQDADAVLQRRRVYDAIVSGLEDLQRSITHEDILLPLGLNVGGEALAPWVCRVLPELRAGREPEGQVFELDVPQRAVRIGEGLLHALRALPEEDLRRFGRLLILHELLHQPQRLVGTTYQGIGRAGVVLEDLDYHADAFALLTATRWEIRDQGARGERQAGPLLRAYLRTHLEALAAFDRMEQGEPLRRLPERRLRRYLLWSLQAARAMTVSQPAQVVALLERRLLVELAPSRGRLDPRGDKLVLSGDADTQIFVALGGALVREARLAANFEPHQLIEQARKLELDALREALRFVVDRNLDTLAPWASL